MEQLQSWLLEKKAERTCEALAKKGFRAAHYTTSAEAREYILSLIPLDATVGWGSSKTLNQIGIEAELKKRNQPLLDPFAPGLTGEEALQVRRRILLSDVFLTGTNAITEDGKLVNIDATGNRVGAMLFGPPRVIVVAGVNKIVSDVHAAIRRIKENTAPMNTKRLGWNTPCAKTGKCIDCNSPEHMCNATVIIEHKMRATELHVVIVGEELGF